jgi:hypothetical protein
MEVTIKTAYGEQDIDIKVGHVIQFENLTYQNSYWGIVTHMIQNKDECLGVTVMVIDPDTLIPMVWIDGTVKFDFAHFQNKIYGHFESLADFAERMGIDNE